MAVIGLAPGYTVTGVFTRDQVLNPPIWRLPGGGKVFARLNGCWALAVRQPFTL
jgi:hypothetical protein